MITIKKNRIGHGLKSAVEELTGVDLNVCLQCKKCSSGCPVAKLARTRPSEIMRLLHLGAGEETARERPRLVVRLVRNLLGPLPHGH